MLSDIKRKLMEDPEKLRELLDYYGFAHVHLKHNELRFARNEEGGLNIRIRLNANDNITTNDYVTGFSKDVIAFIMEMRNVSFRDVLYTIKRILNISDFEAIDKPKIIEPFGGFYSKLRKRKQSPVITVYPETILNEYDNKGNLRFLDDNISLESQRFFDLRYDSETDRIIIPIRNEYGELVGVKGRYNGDAEGDIQKYYYPYPVSSSQILFGYSENYAFLQGNEVLVCESEKAVMQAYSYGYRNCLGLGSHTLSEKHVQLIYQLEPTKVIMAMDKGLKDQFVNENINALRNYTRMSDMEIWKWIPGNEIPDKASPTDMGKEKFRSIMETQMERINVEEI